MGSLVLRIRRTTSPLVCALWWWMMAPVKIESTRRGLKYTNAHTKPIKSNANPVMRLCTCCCFPGPFMLDHHALLSPRGRQTNSHACFVFSLKFRTNIPSAPAFVTKDRAEGDGFDAVLSDVWPRRSTNGGGGGTV